jgi:acyl transferase domain-containing protein
MNVMNVAFLFPGQGSQRAGMLHRLPDTAASATVLAEADWALRQLARQRAERASQTAPTAGGAAAYDPEYAEFAGGIAELDTAEALERSPVACHLALLIAGVAGARALTEDEGVRPGFVVGHGLGGYAAAVLAGVLTFEEALKAVWLRGELLARGEEPELDLAIRLAQHLATIKRRPQVVPYVSAVYGRCFRNDSNGVFDDLARSVAYPVRWSEAVATLAEEGAACCVEMPPGRVLTGLVGAEPPGLRAVSVEERGIAEAADEARAVSASGDGWDAGGEHPGTHGGPEQGAGGGGPVGQSGFA